METFTLKAETSRLLDLVIHSLYTKREIFLRELISNASDALDRLRFESMLRPELVADGSALEIRLEVDVAARTLTVRDTGIGMSRDEVVSHIGTIAKSGTREFQAQLETNPDRAQAMDLIGRFGVGFYSSFMAADKVSLVTRRAGEQNGTRWESHGDVNYTLAEVSDAPRGTAVTLHLKAVDAEAGIEDYIDRSVLSRIVKRYADFVTYPISYVGPSGESAAAGATETSVVTVVLNSMKPIWTRPQSDVKPEEYEEFYRHISHDWNDSLLRMSFRAEGRWEYAALLYVPSRAPYDLYYHGGAYGLQLYSQRMLVVENCQDLLPRYLRFLKGVVDAADLPLNVSRQGLQNAHHLTSVKKWLTRKVIETLGRLRESDKDKYLSLWREFGRALKEGIGDDLENKDRLTPLILFESSADPSALTSLAEYVSRMKADQKDIFYLAGESRTVIERSPHLEQVRARGYEVLYFTDPVDELLTHALSEFDGKRLRSAGKGQLELGDDAEREQAEKAIKEQTERLGDLLKYLAKHLEAHVRDVKLSRRLTVSPACLAGEEFDLSPHIDRLLQGKGSRRKRTLELNPDHAIVKDLHEQFAKNGATPMTATTAEVLFGMALLAEGSELPDPAAFTNQVADLLGRALGQP